MDENIERGAGKRKYATMRKKSEDLILIPSGYSIQLEAYGMAWHG